MLRGPVSLKDGARQAIHNLKPGAQGPGITRRTDVARIAGVNIPTNKRVVISLRYIHGIGPVNAVEICDKVKIAHSKRVNELSDAEVLAIREVIEIGRAHV